MALAHAARMLIGSRFSLGGSDPETGVDCFGLVVAALAKIGRPAPAAPARTMRGTSIDRFVDLAGQVGLQKISGPPRIGDVLLLVPSCAQHHLAIQVNNHSVIHAHAGLRRVVQSPSPLPWPLIGQWRLDPTGEVQWPQ